MQNQQLPWAAEQLHPNAAVGRHPIWTPVFDGTEIWQYPLMRNGYFNSAAENYLLGESNPRIIQIVKLL